MSLDRKAGSQLVEARAVYKVLMADKPYILQKESTFPFLLLKNVAEMYAEVAQSVLTFSSFV